MIRRRRNGNGKGGNGTQRNEGEAKVLAGIQRVVNSSAPLTERYEQIDDYMRELLPVDRMAIGIVDLATGVVFREFYSGMPDVGSSPDIKARRSTFGFTDEILETGKPVKFDDIPGALDDYPGLGPAVRAGIASGIYVPVFSDDTVIGLLGASSKEPAAFEDADVDLLQRIGNHLTSVVLQAQSVQRSYRETRERELLDEIGKAANSNLDIEKTLDRVFENLGDLLPVDRISVSVRSAVTGSLNIAYASGTAVAPSGDGRAFQSSDDGLRSLVSRTGKSRLVNDVSEVLEEAPGAIRMLESGLRSAIFAPLITDGETIGVIGIHAAAVSSYTMHDLYLIERLAVQLSGAFAYAQLSAAVDHQRRQQMLLLDTGRAIDASTDLEAVYEELSKVVEGLVPCDRFTVVILDEDTDTFQERFIWGEELVGYEEDQSISLSGSITEYVITTGETVMWPSAEWSDERLSEYPAINRARAAGLEAFISVPVIVADKTVGVLHFDGFENWVPEEREKSTAQSISAHLGGALSRLHLIERVDQLARDEALLAEIGRVATSLPDIDAVFGRFSELLSTVVDFDGISLSTVDAERGTLTVRFVGGAEIPGFTHTQEHVIDSSHTGAVLQAGVPVSISGDELDDIGKAYPILGEFLEENGIHSRMVVPIFHIDRPVGALTLHSGQPDAFSQRQIEITKRIGDQISGALVNAELRAELARNADEESLIAEIGRIATSSPEFIEVFDAVVVSIARLVSFDRIAVAHIDMNTGVLETRFVAGMAVRGFQVGDKTNLSEAGLNRLDNLPGHGELFSTEIDYESFVGVPHGVVVEVGLKTGMVATLRSHGVVIGNLSIRSKEVDAYDERDLDLLTKAAAQLSGAFANSEFHAQAEQRAREEKLLAEISRVVTASPNFNDIFDALVPLISERVQFDRIAITLIDIEGGVVQTRFVSGTPMEGFDPGEIQNFPPEILANLNALWEDGEIFESTDFDGGTGGASHIPAINAGLLHGMAANLRARGTVVGNMSVRTKSSVGYHQNDLEWLKKVATQLSGAFANSELHDEVERRAREVEALSEIGRVITASPDFGEVFDTVVPVISRLISFDRIAISRIDLQRSLVHNLFESGIALEGIVNGENQVVPKSVLDEYERLDDGELFESEEIGKDVRSITEAPALAAGLRSGMSAKLLSHGELIGNVTIRSRHDSAYDQKDLDLLIKVTAQLSGAFVNSQLHQEADRTAIEESILARISRDVGSLFEPESTLDRILGDLGQLVPADRVTIALLDEGTGQFEYAYLSGITVDTGTSERSSNPSLDAISARVADTGEAVVVGDASKGEQGLAGLRNLVDGGLRASVAVPLIWNGETIGVFGASATDPDVYEEHHVDLVRRVASQLAGWVVNARLHSSLERQARINAVLADIGREASSSLDPKGAFVNLVDHLSELISAETVMIAVVDSETDRLRMVFSTGMVEKVPLTTNGIPFAVVSSGKSMFTNNTSDAVAAYPGAQNLVDAGVKSIIVVPVVWEEETIGIFSVAASETGAYHDDDQQIVERVAQHIAGTVVNAELHTQVEQQARDQGLLAEIGRVVNSDVAPEETFAHLASLIKDLIPAQRVSIGTKNDEANTIVYTVVGPGPTVIGRMTGDALPLEGSVAAFVMDSKEPYIWPTDDPDVEPLPGMAPFIAAGANSSVTVPLMSVDRPVGVMSLANFNGDKLSTRDMAMAEAVAAQISGAVANADLFVRAGNEARERTVLAEIGRLFGSSLEIDELCKLLTEPLNKLVPYDRLSISTYDPRRDGWYVRHAVGIQSEIQDPSDELSSGLRNATRATRLLLDRRETISIRDHADLSDQSRSVGYPEAGLRSSLLVPMITGNQVIGCIAIHSAVPDAFTAHHVELSELVARQIASAFNNASVHGRTVRDSEERTALAEIGRLAGSSLDAEEFFARLAPAVNKLIPNDRLAVSSYDTAADIWSTDYTSGVHMPNAQPGDEQNSSTPVSRHIIERKTSILVRDQSDQDGLFSDPRAVAADLHSLALSPMLEGDTVIGAIGVHSCETSAYTDHHVALLEQIATQLVGAFLNADLHAQVERQAREQALLAEIGRVVNSSSDVQDVFERLATLVGRLTSSHRVTVVVGEPGSSTVTVLHSSDQDEHIPLVPGRVIPLPGTVAEYVMETRGTFVWPEPDKEYDPPPSFPGLTEYLDAGLSSIIATPLFVLDRPIGSLFLHNFDGSHFSQHDVEMARAVADQIAGAVANANLFAQTEREARERTAVAEIGRLIGSTLELSDIYDRVAEQIRDLLPFDRLSLVRVDQESETITSLYSYGPGVNEWESGAVGPLKGSIAETLLTTQSGVLINSTSTSDLVKRFPGHAPLAAVMELRSVIAVPLMHQGNETGVLHLTSSTPGTYSDFDLQLAGRVGSQVASALVNADLFARSEEQAQEREQLAEIGRIVGSTLELGELWPRLIGPIKNLFSYDRLAIVLIDPDSGYRWTEYVDGVPMKGVGVGVSRILETPSSLMMQSEQPFLIRDASDSDEQLALMGRQEFEHGFRSKAGVPIIFSAAMVGELDLKSFLTDAYSEGDLDRLDRVARLIAGAITTARLHSTVATRAEEEQVISAIGRLVSASLDFGSSFDEFADLVKQLVPYDRFVILGLDVESRLLWTHFVKGVEIPGWGAGTSRVITGWGEGIYPTPPEGVIYDVEPGQDVDEDPAIKVGLPSLAVAPLIWEGRTVGNISARSTEIGKFTPHHLELLRRVAQQIVGAFVNAELHAVTAQDAAERAVLGEIGRLVSSSLDVSEMFDAVAEPFSQLVPYDRLTVTAYDGEHGIWTTRYVIGAEVPGYEVGTTHPDDDASTWWLSDPPRPVIVNSKGDIPDSSLIDEMNEAHLYSALFIPLIVNGEVVGALSARSLESEFYTQRHLELARRIGSQIAGSVANAELHAVTAREATERDILAEIGRMVSSSLDFGDVFDQLALSLKQLVPYDRFTIMGLDPETRDLWTHYVAGVEVAGWEAGTLHKIADWQQGVQLMPLEGVLIESAKDDYQNEQVMYEAGLLANASVPLIWEGRAVGALSVRTRELGQLTTHHLELLGRVGQQIIGTFVNAELHAVTVKEAEERAGLAEIGRLVSSSLDVQEMFEAIARPLNDLIPFHRFAVSTYDSVSDAWTTRFAQGDELPGHAVGDQNKTDLENARAMISHRTPVLTGGDEEVPESPGAIAVGLLSSVLVPLVVNQETIGILTVRSRNENAYTQRHLDLAHRIADQIAGNVANSELHRALADSEARTRAVVETAAVGIVTADDRLMMRTVNDAVTDIFGFTRDELIGMNVMVLAAEPYRSEHDGYLDNYNRTNDPKIIGTYREVEGRRKDGSTFPMELEVTRVDLAHGRMYTGVIRDITDRKQAESEVREMAATLENRVLERTEQLQQANSELEAFSYTVSHDLRGPLAMNAHLAARLLESEHESLSDTSRKYIELIARSSTESADLVTDLLNFARLGQQKLDVHTVDPGEIVRSLHNELSELNPLVQWTLNDLPECDADPGLLRAVFINLLSNACKFSAQKPNPSIEIGATENDGETIYFVKDNGVGFDMEQEHRVFEVFERLHRPEDYVGTGAGLAIVRRIVERHGGRIWADSEVEVGTTFFFTLALDGQRDPSGK